MTTMNEKVLETIKNMSPEEYQKAREAAIKTLQKRGCTEKEYHRKRYTKNSEKLKAYRQVNKAHRKVHDHEYYLAHIDKFRKVNKKARETHKEEYAKYAKEYAETHKDELRIYMHDYYESHKEEEREYHEKSHLLNPGLRKAARNRRRVSEEGAIGSFTAKEFNEKCDTFLQLCVYCGEEKDLGPDHVIPLSKGGSNNIENILPACKPCNCSKGTKSFEEFLALRSPKEQESIMLRIYLADHPEELEALCKES